MKNQKVSTILTEMGKYPMPDGRPAMVHLAAAIWKGALSGDKTFVKILLDRLEGRPPVAEVEPSLPETDSLITKSLLAVYGPVTEEERKAVKPEVLAMAQNSVEARDIPFK